MLTVDTLNREWLSAEQVIVLIATGRLLQTWEIEEEAIAGFRQAVTVKPGDAREWDAAVDVLAAAALAGKIAAWGRRAKAFGEPDHAAPLEQVPAGHFARLRVMVSNWTHPRNARDGGPVWWQVGFKRREALNLWPAGPERDRAAKLAAHMLAMVKGARPRMKREAALAKLRKDAGCTAREALAAWNAQTSDLRGARGKRPA